MGRPHGRSESAIFGKVFLQISKKSGCLLRPLGSSGFLEFSVRNGNFAGTFGVSIGAPVEAITSIDE